MYIRIQKLNISCITNTELSKSENQRHFDLQSGRFKAEFKSIIILICIIYV